MEIVGGVLAVVVVCAALAFAFHRLSRSYGRADSVSQLFLTRGGALLTVEQQRASSGGRIQSAPDGRLSLRSLTDGQTIARCDVHGSLVVLGTDARGDLVSSDAERSLHMRDATTLAVRPDVDVSRLGELAPFAALEPRLEGDTLTVLDRVGARRSMRDVIGAVTALPQPGSANARLVGSPRARLERGGRSLSDRELLNARILGALSSDERAALGPTDDVLVISERDLADREALVTRVAGDGPTLFSVPLGRRAEVATWTLAPGTLVLLLRGDSTSPLELVAIDLASGAVRWRCQP